MKSFKDLVVKSIYYKRIVRRKGTYIMDEDWDNLIILDGCRYDMFESVNKMKGKLESRISRGSCTNEFLKQNFSRRKYLDTIYLTGNPLVNYHVPHSFYKIIPVWREGWSEKYGTVLPETITEYSLKVNEKYPQKRLIIHYMQPHFPFIGKNGRKKIGKHDGLFSRNLFYGKKKNSNHGAHLIWNLLKNKKLTKKTVWEAYEENLRIVLNHAERLIEKLAGRTIVTTDHGNLFGERIPPLFLKEYGHPSGIHTKYLVKVPWFIINKENRKNIKRDESGKKESMSKSLREKDIKKKLKSLGYFD